MLNNTIIASILLIWLCACTSSKNAGTGTVSQSTTPVDTQVNANKHKADLSKVPPKSTHEILYDK